MKVRGIIIAGVVMAVVLLIGTGFNGTVYAKEYTPLKDTKTLRVSKPNWIKNTVNEKIFSFVAGDTKYVIHYRQVHSGQYSVWITSVSKNGKEYTAIYTIDQKEHKAWIDGKEVKIEKVVNKGASENRGIHHTWWDGIYCVYGRPQIKYKHPDREYYDLGTWENELLVGHSLYHMQIGTDSIGWISELPGAVVGAVLGALLGAYFGGGPIGAAIGAAIGALIGFITGNAIQHYICDETGAGWQWINKHDVQEIKNALFSPWPWEHWVHIDYYKLGMLGPYSGWVYIPYPWQL